MVPDNTGVKLIVTVVMLLIIYYIWNFTRLGNYVRGIGEKMRSQSGIRGGR